MHITIESLWKLGKSKNEISRITGHDWKTVNKVIKSLEEGKYPAKKAHPRVLDTYRDKILQFMEQNLSGVRIHEELLSLGIKVSYTSVKRYIAEIKGKTQVHIRFHTSPAEEAQVDFGYVGLTVDHSGRRRKTWVFNMRLSYSRLDYYECVYDQKVETFIQCHINGFKSFKGVPQKIKLDNLKAAILEANFYEPVYQGLYKQFADYYGFLPLPCRVREPQEKGKVESGIKFIKANFFAGRKFNTKAELDRKLAEWLRIKCNGRIHGTTRQIPQDIFINEELPHLKALPSVDFAIPNVGQRVVYHDCHVYVDYSYYSVPYEYVGKTVDVEISKGLVKIAYNGKQIAVHQRSIIKGSFTTINAHYPKYKNILSTENQERCLVKMNEIGSHAGQFFMQLLYNCPDYWYRITQGILSLTKQYPKVIVDLACKRALAFEVFNYSTVRNICKQGTYILPTNFNCGSIQ